MAESSEHSARFAKLNGENYTTWVFNMKGLFMYQDLAGFFDPDDLDSPPTPPAALPSDAAVDARHRYEKDVAAYERAEKDFKRRGQKIWGLIVNNICENQQIHIKDTVTAGEAWKALLDAHNSKGGYQCLRLYQKLYGSHLPEGGDVRKHMNELCEIRSKLKEHEREIDSISFALVFLASLMMGSFRR